MKIHVQEQRQDLTTSDLPPTPPHLYLLRLRKAALCSGTTSLISGIAKLQHEAKNTPETKTALELYYIVTSYPVGKQKT